MEITKTDLFEKLPDLYKPYIMAMRTANLKDTKDRKANVFAIKDAILKALMHSMSKKLGDNGAIDFIADSLCTELSIKFPYLRHGQIELAFKKYALYELKEHFPKDHVIQYNAGTLFNAVKSMLNSQDNLEAFRQWDKIQEDAKLIASKPLSDINAVSDEHILSVYNDFVNTGVLPVYARVFYSAICKKKGVETLITDKETRSKIVKETKTNYENWLLGKKYHKREPENFQILMNQMNADNKTYLGFSQKIALGYYFKDCQANNIKPI